MAKITKCYNWRHKLNAEGKGSIDIRISKGKERKYFPTGYLIEPKFWDGKKNEVKKSHPHFQQINQKLNQWVYQFEQKEIELITKGKSYTVQDIIASETAAEKQSFPEWCNKVIKERRSIVSDKHKSLYRLVVKEVVTLKKTENFKVRDIDLDFLYKFQNYLIGKNLNSKTVNKHLQMLSMFINEAVKTGILKPSENCFLDFKYLKEVDTERLIPTTEEIKRLETQDLSNNRILDQVRDMFVFNCYIGLRNADLFALTHENVSIENGETIIHLIENKTNKPNYRNLNVLGYGKGLKILDKYKNADPILLFPKLSDKQIRDGVVMLRTIINARLPWTFYGSRHYCLSDLASHGVPSNEVQRFANHSDLKTTEHYYHSLSLDSHLRERFKR